MMQAPRIVRWTLPALLLTLVVGGTIIVAASGRDRGATREATGSPEPATTTARGRRAAKRVKVRSGDTPTSIAKRAKITLLELLELNPDIDQRALRPGQTLKIPS